MATHMNPEPQPVDIAGSPELLGLAEDVRRSGVGRLLKRGEQELALLTPVAPRPAVMAGSRRQGPMGEAHDSILKIVGIGESAEPTDVARHERKYLAEAYTPTPRCNAGRAVNPVEVLASRSQRGPVDSRCSRSRRGPAGSPRRRRRPAWRRTALGASLRGHRRLLGRHAGPRRIAGELAPASGREAMRMYRPGW